MKSVHKRLLHNTGLLSLFLSIFTFTFASYFHLNLCHGEISQGNETGGYGHVILISGHSPSQECHVCHFLSNNFLNIPSVVAGLLLIFSKINPINPRNPISSISLFQNLARAPPQC